MGIPVLLYIALCLLISGAETDGVAAQPVPPGQLESVAGQQEIELVESNTDRIVIEVNVADYVLAEQVVDGTAYDVVSIPGWGLTAEAGMPQLPMRRVLLGIPPGSELKLRVVDTVARDVGGYHVLPAPETIMVSDPYEQLEPWRTAPQFERRFLEAESVYGLDGPYPGMIARAGDEGSIRSQRVVAIDLYPVQYNPGLQQIRFHSRFRVEISLLYPSSQHLALAGSQASFVPESPNYEQMLREQLLNYDSAKAWRSKSAATTGATVPVEWPLPSEAYKIFVNQDGMYQLTYQDLVTAGVPVDSDSFDPRQIQIFSEGEEVAIRVAGEEDGSFDEEDYVLFYGREIRNKYTDQNVYWLTHEQTSGLRMQERSDEPPGPLSTPAFFTASRRIEEDRDYASTWPGPDSIDRWYWRRLIAYVELPASLTVDADLGHVVTDTASTTAWFVVKGHNAWAEVYPDHHAEFYVNGCYVGDHWWDGKTVEVVELELPAACLNSGTNTFGIRLPGDANVPDDLIPDYVDFVLFDRLDLRYGLAYRATANELQFSQATAGAWRYEVSDFTESNIEVFDISEPLTVTQIINSRIEPVTPTYTLQFSDTLESARTYLAVTPDGWLTVERIVRDSPSNLHDGANGADYIIISHGEFLPAAQALANYRAEQGLRTVVVEVEDVYDEFGYGLSVPEAMRDFVRYAYENWQSPAPAYIVLLGDGTYDPKNHKDQGVVNYVTPYLANVDPWMGETATDNWFVTVVGDDIWPDLFLGRLPVNTLAEANEMVSKTIAYEQDMAGAGWNGHLTFVAGKQPDDPPSAGDFHDLSEDVIEGYVPAFYDVSRVYLGAIPGSTCSSGPECRQQLVDAINAGTLLVNYIGHGSVWSWDGILLLSTINQLTNSDRLPIMLPMTCLEGMFTSPDPTLPSVSESVVRAADKGAVASWGPTGLGVASGHDHLNKGFLDAALFGFGDIRELGPASYAGKLRLYENSDSSWEQIQEYTVFGDPALRIQSLDVADLRLEKTVDAPEVAAPGDILTFTLSFTNAGRDIASGVILTDPIPPVIVTPTVVYSSPNVLGQWEGVTFTWTISDLLPHTGGEIRIRGMISPDAEAPVSFFNTAVITSATFDLDTGNNQVRIGINTRKVYLPLILRGH
jgi:uncharacterized repeat protein (TIGR01451 family)